MLSHWINIFKHKLTSSVFNTVPSTITVKSCPGIGGSGNKWMDSIWTGSEGRPRNSLCKPDSNSTTIEPQTAIIVIPARCCTDRSFFTHRLLLAHDTGRNSSQVKGHNAEEGDRTHSWRWQYECNSGSNKLRDCYLKSCLHHYEAGVTPSYITTPPLALAVRRTSSEQRPSSSFPSSWKQESIVAVPFR